MKRKLRTTLGVTLVMGLAAQIAKADFVLTLDDSATGGTEVIVADNVAAGVFLPGSGLTTTHADGGGDLGFIFFNGAIGGFLSNTVTGQSKPLLGDPPRINLTSSVASNGPGVMTISLTDTEFSSASPFNVDNAVGGVTDGTVLSEWGTDLDNVHFSFASGFGSLGPLGPQAFDGQSSIGPFGADPSFSLSNSVTVTHPGGSSVSSFSSTVSVPEPGTALLLITSAGFLLRRR